MSGNDKYNDDDYVAKLLAEDAKKSSQRYASAGLSGLLSRRPQKAALRPNTRFLNHLVREVDSHNTALKKKEELEARIRLREVKARENKDKTKSRDDRDEDNYRESKRRRVDVDDRDKKSHRHRRSREDRESRSPPRGSKNEHEKHRTHSTKDDSERRTKKSRHRDRSRSPRRQSRHDRKPSSQEQIHRPSSRKHHRSRSRSSSVSSDPLANYIGQPKHQLQKPTRGRGSTSASTSNIDLHFSAAYNPNLDVHPDSPLPETDQNKDRSDWDMALEALRDRQQWQRKQADRMREAGFGEDEIERWEKQKTALRSVGEGRDDGDVESVKWKKKGELREWDVGKKDASRE